jgi:hypothetical protein
MANWTHTYREQAIPGPSPSGLITEHRPGQKLAKAVTEIQERVVVDVEADLEGIEDTGTVVENNTLKVRLRTEPTVGVTQNFFAVAGGEWPELFVQELAVENGLIKNVSDGQELYPNIDLYTGPIVVNAELSFGNGVLTIKLTERQVEKGVVINIQETEREITVEIDGLPPGGTQYQVLQRNESGTAVWDYVRAVEVS